jgi:hypothetical protein
LPKWKIVDVISGDASVKLSRWLSARARDVEEVGKALFGGRGLKVVPRWAGFGAGD